MGLDKKINLLPSQKKKRTNFYRFDEVKPDKQNSRYTVRLILTNFKNVKHGRSLLQYDYISCVLRIFYELGKKTKQNKSILI